MKAYCKKCKTKIEKPKWEHLIYAIYKAGGHAGENKCPGCKNKTLEFSFKVGD